MEDRNDLINNENQDIKANSPNNNNNLQSGNNFRASYNPNGNQGYVNNAAGYANNTAGYVNNTAGYANNSAGYNRNNYMPSILDSLSGWMKFMGIYTIIVGALTCLGIITAAIGIPMIFSGIGLHNASKSLKEYKELSNQFSLNDFFAYLHKYFKIQGIFVIIGIVLSVLYITFLIVFLVLALYTYNGIGY